MILCGSEAGYVPTSSWRFAVTSVGVGAWCNTVFSNRTAITCGLHATLRRTRGRHVANTAYNYTPRPDKGMPGLLDQNLNKPRALHQMERTTHLPSYN